VAYLLSILVKTPRAIKICFAAMYYGEQGCALNGTLTMHLNRYVTSFYNRIQDEKN